MDLTQIKCPLVIWSYLHPGLWKRQPVSPVTCTVCVPCYSRVLGIARRDPGGKGTPCKSAMVNAELEALVPSKPWPLSYTQTLGESACLSRLVACHPLIVHLLQEMLKFSRSPTSPLSVPLEGPILLLWASVLFFLMKLST